ncbi:MAG TPA: hypothetical protein VGL42_06260 [Opitutaceae bacterium]
MGASEERVLGGRVDGPGGSAVTQLAQLLGRADAEFDVIGHRLVHGGSSHIAPERITAVLLRDLKKLAALDPEHLPPALRIVAALRRAFPGRPDFACFDTAFHHGMPDEASRFALPRKYFRAGIRRYGFHGLSFSFLMEELARLAGRPAARGKVLLAHLGGGASLAAVRGGKPIDTTMGFMPSGGLMMATRCGDLDPGVILRLWESGLSRAALSRLVNQESGLLGVSGRSADLRVVQARARRDPACDLAIRMLGYSALKHAGAMAAALGGLDTLVFSGGIGEHSPAIRARIARGLGFAGVAIDPARNRRNAPVISRPGSRITVRVIATDEERMIARAGVRLFS